MPQSQTAANPRYQEEEKNDKKLTNKQMHENPSSSSQVITMLKGMTKHEDKEQVKTSKHEAPRSINYKATQNKNNTGTTALERSVA